MMIFQSALHQSLQLNKDRTAIEYDGQKISYATLQSKADKVSGFLLKKSLERETIVGIDLEARPEIICSIIGVAAARCIFVLLDRNLPDSRMDHMINDMALDCVITSSDRFTFYQKRNVSSIWDLEAVQAAKSEDSQDIVPTADPDDGLYIYYTSGSTGVPKAILGENSSLLKFLQWEVETFSVDSSFRVSQVISPYFDAFLRDVFVPLMSGATICIPPQEEDIFSEDKLITWIDGADISLIHCVPSLFEVFNSKKLTKSNFTNLRYVLMSGEKITPSNLSKWYEVFEDRIQLVNLYGTTEATMIQSYYLIQPKDTKLTKIPIGTPRTDTVLLIANKEMKPCATLAPGELYIISDYLTKGYLNAPEQTKEKFVILNEGTPEQKRAYKTGDLALKLPSGHIELIGRQDRQVKIRGIRVELDEVEASLTQSDLQEKSIVTMIKDDGGSEAMIAFIVKKDQKQSDQEVKQGILNELKDRLPHYMIPSDVVLIDQVPLLSNGKTDYKALKRIKKAAREMVLPTDQIEEQILGIWKDLLGDKPISTADIFHRIGGNSLTLMSLIARINKAFEVKISLSQIFKSSTIQKQADFIREAKKEEVETIPSVEKATHYALSSAQKRLFFLSEFSNNALIYNMPQIAKLDGAINNNLIEKVFRKLIARHESLRTSFELQNGVPVQKISDQVDFNIEYFDTADAAVADIIARFIRSFDLSAPSLFRAGIVKVSSDQHILMVDMHHIVSDGVSNEILLEEFMALYKGDTLPEVQLTYKDFATWQQSPEKQQKIALQRNFWLRQFTERVDDLMLPTDFSRPSVKTFKGTSFIFGLDNDAAKGLQEMAKEEGVTMFMLLLALYNVLLSKLSGQEDIVVGSPIAGRHHHEAMERMIGMCVSTLPLRNQPKGTQRFKEFLADLKSKTVASFENQDYPFEDLVNELNIERRANRTPLFDVSFAFQNFKSSTLALPGLVLQPYIGEQTVSKFDLSMLAYEKEGQLSFTLEYSTELFSKETIQRFAEYFSTLVAAVVENPESRLSDLAIIPAPEVEKQLVSFNETAYKYDQKRTVLADFAEQVRTNPDQVALEFGTVSQTYKELDEESLRIAGLLQREGIRSGD
ncbi:MAG: amino acid adenylation domain-containing protein, partial [Bacteroidota bacterium]